VADEYAYTAAQCDIGPDRRSALDSYRAKRRLWLSWISSDEHHAIWNVLSDMVWTDVVFKQLTSFAIGDDGNGLNNRLLTEALLNGHVATQVLAIRRLMDDRNADIISLRRLLKDLKRNWPLFTRENYVCFDGLPYDYQAVQLKDMEKHVGTGFFWGETTGPGAYGTSEMAHEQFDRLSGIDLSKRTREDCLPMSLLTTIEHWLDDSEADQLKEWSHAYLAHAGGPESRRKIAALSVTADKITNAIKAMSRATEAVSAYILFHGGRSGSLVPVPQYAIFDKLDRPITQAGGKGAANEVWHQLSDERDHYLDGIEDALIFPKRHVTPRG
jgi:hypothetical protein